MTKIIPWLLWLMLINHQHVLALYMHYFILSAPQVCNYRCYKLERWSNLPQVPQLESGWVRIQSRTGHHQSPISCWWSAASNIWSLCLSNKNVMSLWWEVTIIFVTCTWWMVLFFLGIFLNLWLIRILNEKGVFDSVTDRPRVISLGWVFMRKEDAFHEDDSLKFYM